MGANRYSAGQSDWDDTVIPRLLGALLRASLVGLLAIVPVILLGAVHSVDSTVYVVGAFLVGVMIFSEYSAAYPSLIEFRDSPPFNRMRYMVLLAIVVGVSLVVQHAYSPNNAALVATSLGALATFAFDYPYAPVHLMALVGAEPGALTGFAVLRFAAALAFGLGLISLLICATLLRLRNWPLENGSFNVWVNLPLFDPTSGGDVIERLNRAVNLNLAIAFLLPFVIPAVLSFVSGALPPLELSSPIQLIWTVSLWAYLPVSYALRAVALAKVSSLIAEKRRRTYGKQDLQPV